MDRPFDFRFPYPSRRMPVLARQGVVATSHPLAAQAGLRMLLAGGNAVDAAVAAAIALTVVEPTSNGIGGDAFALVWDGQRLHGLNASGPCPAALTPEVFERQGLDRVPLDGWLAVTVPGVVAGWVELARRFGSMPLTELARPAIQYAREGHAVPPHTAMAWAAAARHFGDRREFREAFLPGGRAPAAGEVFRFPDQARTLEMVAQSAGEEFYRGELARRIAAHARATGGFLTEKDLAAYRPEWVQPISTTYRGVELWEIPPNGQGIAALMALNILEPLDPSLGAPAGGGPGDERLHARVRWLHAQIEAMKLAFADAHRYVADPRHAAVPVEGLLDRGYASRRRSQLRFDRAIAEPTPGMPIDGGTVYLCAADSAGRMVSYIQSNFHGFGSGVVVPGTGIAFQNRGAGFTLEPGHPNRLAPGKRPYHTIIPAFLTAQGQPLAAFGVMGGDMQPQGHMQVLSRIVDERLNPQAALDAPRFRVIGGARVAIEGPWGREVAGALAALGHEVLWEPVESLPGGLASGAFGGQFGGGQMIWRDPETGVYVAGSDPRKDGQAVGY